MKNGKRSIKEIHMHLAFYVHAQTGSNRRYEYGYGSAAVTFLICNCLQFFPFTVQDTTISLTKIILISGYANVLSH
jgi:hypothetical protein